VSKKRLVLDAPISDYYKGFPPDKMNLTLRQLGGHQAGIRHYAGLEFFSNIHYINCIDPLEIFIHDTLLFAPGTRYSYSTYGWTVVSAVMEKDLKMPFPEIIHRDVVTPLHLKDLKPDQVDSIHYQRVHFYEYQDSVFQVSPVVDNSNKWAGGGFYVLRMILHVSDFHWSKKGISKALP
jgi:CubicO group peptidase (beta-lactamase class C family)